MIKSREMIKHALLAYEDVSTISKQLKHATIKYIDIDNIQLFIAIYNDYQVISFAGTNEVADCFTDINISLSKYCDYGRFHNGSMLSVLAVSNEIIGNIDLDKDIYITGHSLGGGLATIFAVVLHERFNIKTIMGIYTFGSLRVCDYKMADSYDSIFKDITIRYVFNGDIITRLATSWRYKHVGKLRYINKDKITINNVTRWNIIKDRIKSWISNPLKEIKQQFSKHFVINYYKAIYD